MTSAIRDACEASFRAAVRQSGTAGALVLTHASYAGMLLRSHGSAGRAARQCPEGAWFDEVRRLLGQIHQDETGPNLRAINGGKTR